MYNYKIRIASWSAVHVCEGSLQVARLSAILLYIFLGKIFSHCYPLILFSKIIVGRFLVIFIYFLRRETGECIFIY